MVKGSVRGRKKLTFFYRYQKSPKAFRTRVQLVVTIEACCNMLFMQTFITLACFYTVITLATEPRI